MSDLIDKINKVRYGDFGTRKKWFFITVISLFGFIFLVWIIIFGSVFRSLGEKDIAIKEQEGSFSEFWGSFKNGISIVREKMVTGIDNISNIIK
ncbi:MAG: hypothetical protein WC705_02450 [Candidatus Paceibacterota bacterium]|jgi:hypothetical protein